MFGRFAQLLSLMVLVSAPPAAPVRAPLERLIDRAEVDCLLRAPQDGVRWQWNGSYCVGLIVGRLDK